ncbi:MAG: hypothetical protein VXW32_00450 [Myxococcota bacterium]|nr:hypothetical protein [Myxococcota bacterium]
MPFPQLFIATLLVMSPLAGAHPMGEKPASHRLRVQILQDQLVIGYLAEIPTRLIVDEREAASETELELFSRLHSELSQGIAAHFQNTPLSLSSSAFQAEDVRQNPRSVGFELHLTSPRPGENGTLKITNANLSEHHAYFYTELIAEDPIAVTSSSLVTVMDGAEEVDFNGRWSVLESQRELTISLSDWRMHEERGPMRTGAALLSRQPRTPGYGKLLSLLVGSSLLLALWRRRIRRLRTP